jgi:hypothetical protein
MADTAGTARSLDLRISGASKVRASALECEEATIRLSGSGKVAVWATRVLRARVSGAGVISYRGAPRIEQRITGAAVIEPLDAEGAAGEVA